MNLKNINFEYLLEKLTLGSFEIKNDFDLIITNKLEKIISVSANVNCADSLYVKRSVEEITALTNKPLKYLSD